MVSFLGFVTALVSHHLSVVNAQNTFTRINPKRNGTHIGAFRMKHGDVSLKRNDTHIGIFRMSHGNVSLKLNRNRQKQMMPRCADQKKNHTFSIFFSSKNHDDHQETHGREELAGAG